MNFAALLDRRALGMPIEPTMDQPHLHFPDWGEVRSVVGPRVLQGGVIPILINVLGVYWFGFWPAVLTASAWTLFMLWRRWRVTRRVSGLLAISATMTVVRITVALLAESPMLINLQPAITALLLGLVFMGSVMINRTFIEVVVVEIWPELAPYEHRPDLEQTWRAISLVWAFANIISGSMTLVLALTQTPGTTLVVRSALSPVITSVALGVSATWLFVTLARCGLLHWSRASRCDCAQALEAH